MQQLTYVALGKLEWRDVAAPQLREPTDALVRPFIAGRCDGDAFFLKNRVSSYLGLGARLHLVEPSLAEQRHNPFVAPFACGHECVAEIVEVGASVTARRVGERVIVPWAVSCGSCPNCVAGLTSHCERATGPLAAYGFGSAFGSYGGFLSDLVRVPYADHMLVPVPLSIDPLDVASASDNLCDAYRAVAPLLARTPGAAILIVGGAAKSIGLYAAGLAKALGSTRVDYLDTSVARLEIAAALGANPVRLERSSVWYRRSKPPLAGGYAGVIDASSTTEGLTFALDALAPGGTCTAVGFYLRRTTPLPLWRMFMKSATLHVGVSHPRRDLPAVLALIERGTFSPKPVHVDVSDWQHAHRAFLERSTKVIVQRAPLGLPPSS
jgi:threonine dehydrogenase-like Zn-dependent dehydrogenase